MTSRVWFVAAALLLAGVAAVGQLTEERPLTQPQYGPAPSDQFAPLTFPR